MKSQVLTYLLLLSWGFCSAQSDWNKGDNSPVIINKNKHIVTLLGFEPTDIIRSSEGANISLNCISENNKIEINYLNDNFVITV